MQADLIASLHARVDLLMAEADELLVGGVTSAVVSARPPMCTPPSAQPDAHVVVPLPARVFFPVQVHTFACHVNISHTQQLKRQLLKLYSEVQQCCQDTLVQVHTCACFWTVLGPDTAPGFRFPAQWLHCCCMICLES